MTRRTALWLALVLAPLPLLAPALAQEPLDAGIARPFQPDPVQGHVVAVKLCASCHIVDDQQNGVAQPGIPSFMHIAASPGRDADYLAAKMIHPYPPMIDTHLTAHEIQHLSAYIQSLKK